MIDGDTIDVRAEIWPDHFAEKRIRLAAVDTPEMPPRSRCEREQALAVEATNYVQAVTISGVTLFDLRPGRDGRHAAGLVSSSSPRRTGVRGRPRSQTLAPEVCVDTIMCPPIDSMMRLAVFRAG